MSETDNAGNETRLVEGWQHLSAGVVAWPETWYATTMLRWSATQALVLEQQWCSSTGKVEWRPVPQAERAP
jgi:hypothetical protein